MPDCPGAGSGDPRDYEHRSLEEQRSDRIAKVKEWIRKQGVEVERLGVPKDGEYFINYPIEGRIGDCSFYWFVPDGNFVKESERRILQAEYTPIFGIIDEFVTNFDKRYRYYVVKHKQKVEESQ